MSQHEAPLQWTPAGEPLLEALRHELRRARERSPLDRITVVTPSFQSAFFLRRRLATDGSLPRGLFNVSFERLEDLADRLAAARPQRPPISELRATELVHMVATDASSALPPALERLRQHPAFHAALHATFRELRAAPEAGDRLGASANPMTRAIGGLWRRYQQGAARFTDRLDTARLAMEALDAGTAGGPGQVVVLAIEEPASQYRPFLDALIALPQAATLIAATGDAAADAAMRLPGPRADTRPDAPLGTHVVSALDPAEEARWIVRDVVRLAREGKRLGRLGVFYAGPEDGARLVEAFRASGVPVSGPNPSTLAQGPEGRWVLGLLDVCTSDLTREAVAAWITGSPVRNPAQGGRPVAGSRWDAIARRAGIVGGAGQWRERLRAHASRCRAEADRDGAEEEVSAPRVRGKRAEADEAEALAGFVETVAVDTRPPPDGSPWSEFAAWLEALCGRYFEAAVEPAVNDPGGAPGTINALTARLRGLDELGGPGPDLDRFVAVVREDLDRSAPLPRERDRAGFAALGRGVFVAPLRQAVGCDFDRVYIAGMAEGRYPGRPIEDPLLPDSERAALDPGGSALPRRVHRRASARRRYLTALATAPERVLLWPRVDAASGRATGPALWWLESARALYAAEAGAGARAPSASEILAGGPRRWLTLVGRVEAVDEPASAGDSHEYDVRSVAGWVGEGRPAATHFLAGEGGGLLRRARELEAARLSPRWTPFDGDLTGDPPGAAAFEDHPVSPTRLETWATCPFRYFLSHVLRIAAIETPEETLTISPADRGSLVHRILERFLQVRRDGEVGGPLGRAEQEGLLLAEAERMFAEFRKRGLTGHPWLWSAEETALRRQLRRFLDQEAEFLSNTGTAPAAWELRFGFEDSETPAVEIGAPGGRTLRFRGVIDRVDLSDDGKRAVVSDYKTGSQGRYTAIRDDPVNRGRLLQLPVYAAAVRSRWPEVAEIDAAYWFVFRPGRHERIGAPVAELEGAMAPVVEEIATAIAGGLFPARPGEEQFRSPENCRYCDFDRLCSVRRARQWERKKHDPRLAAYVRLAEGEAQ